MTITDGSHYSPATSEEGYPYITVRDLNEGLIDFDDCKRVAASDYADLKRNGCAPRRGDVLFSKDGTVGKVALVNADEEFVVLSSLAILRPDPSKIDSSFLAYSLQAPEFLADAIGRKTGVAIRRVILKNLKSMSVPLPPLEEQRRIVAVLDEAFAAIATATANAEKNVANSRQLFEAAFRERFDHVGNGWKIYRLPDIAENWDYLRRPVTKSDRVPGDVPYYGASGQVDSVRDHLFDDDLLLVSEDGANLLMRTYPIAFSISGKAWVNNHAHILKFDDMATQRLVQYYLNSISIAPWVSGMAQPKLNQKALNNIPIPLPPVEEREQLVTELDDLASQIEQLEAIQYGKLAILADLNQSLLHRAFSGELTEREPLAA